MIEDQRISIVHVCGQLSTGGMEKLLVEFARHIDRRRFRLRFVSLNGRGPVAEELEALDWPVVALEQPAGLRWGLALRLAQQFRAWAPDVVHTHNMKPVCYAGPAARLARVPVLIHTRHGQHYHESRRHRLNFRVASHLADRVICVSEDSTRLSAQQGVRPKALRTILNGIDVRRFAYAGPDASGPAVMVGRLSPEKDPQTLVRAAAMAAHEEPSFRLEIAGNGPCLGELQRLTQELGAARQVRLLGEVRDIPALLARASFFVLPSLTEGISLTLIEAMARGLAVVATRVGGNPEVVVEGRSGLLVPAAEPTALARAMLGLHRDPELSRRMGMAGHERVNKNFDATRMVRQYQDLYLECLGASRRDRAAA